MTRTVFGLCALSALLVVSVEAQAQRYVIPLHVHDAGLLEPSGALASQRYLEVSVESANRWFAAAGVCFFVQAQQPFPQSERYNRIKRQLPRGGAIHAAIVRHVSLDGRRMNGVASGDERVMAISRVRANRLTMAHELGHILGLEHSDGGVMNPGRHWWSPDESMSRESIRRVRRRARALVARFGNWSARRCTRASIPDPAEVRADDPLLIHATRTYDSGSRYEGTLLFGRRHGIGKIVYGNNGARYEGMWRLGLRHGQGSYVHGRRRYVGDWSSDLRNGHGHEVYSDGDEYVGAFVDDHRHGLGEYRYIEGGVYRGNWRRGDRTGFGQYIFTNGDRHEGEWRRSQRHGFGTYRFRSGRRLVGQWRNGRHTSTDRCSR